VNAERTLKVTLLSTSFPLAPGSASGIFVARLVDRLAELIDVIVITPADTTVNERVQRGNAVVIPCRYAPGRWQLLTHRPGGLPVSLQKHRGLWLLVPTLLLSLAWRCLREARSSDVLHANWAICGCIAGFVGLFLQKPVLTTLRGEDVTRAAKNRIDNLLLKLCVKISRGVVCVSNDMLDWLNSRLPAAAHKLILIENGVDEGFLKVGGGRVRQAGRDTVRFITVGSLIPRKGIDQIIQALAQINISSQLRLEIVGGGPEETRLRKLADDLKVSDQVYFSGPVAPEYIPGKLSEADIFILASHSEGRPNALVEAMAAGMPVIASDISGVRELVEQHRTGLLFTDGNAGQLAGHMQALVSDRELRERLGRAGHEFVIGRGYTWSDCARRYIQVYRQIAQG